MHPLHAPVATLLRQVAAEVVLPRFRHLTATEVEEKTPGDLVTIADRESEARLAEALVRIDPDARVIGEEASEADPSLLRDIATGRVWIVDPIDGTNNFAAGRAPFGLMVALADDGQVEAGWLYDPLTDQLCHAVRGGGALVDGARVRTSPSGRTTPVATVATYWMNGEQQEALTTRVGSALSLVPGLRCAAAQYPALVSGEHDLARFERIRPWDHAPGALFLEEAGGRVGRADGSPYRIDDLSDGLLAAATPDLWAEAAALLF